MIKTTTYISDKQAPRNKIFLPDNLISLLERGEKVVHYANKTTTIRDNQFVLLSSGNCLTTEKLPIHNSYMSTMIFFDHQELSSFLVKYASLIEKISSKPNENKTPFVVFEKDDFVKNYITSIKIIQAKPASFSNKMVELKFEELMLHLLEKYPNEIVSFEAKNKDNYADFEIRKTVELNIHNNLSVGELSFLCNMSVSTFKRKFIKLYKETPNKYILHQRMDLQNPFCAKMKILVKYFVR